MKLQNPIMMKLEPPKFCSECEYNLSIKEQHSPACSHNPNSPIAQLRRDLDDARTRLSDAEAEIAMLRGQPDPRRSLATWPGDAMFILATIGSGKVLFRQGDRTFCADFPNFTMDAFTIAFLEENKLIEPECWTNTSQPYIYRYAITDAGRAALAESEATPDER